MSSLYRSQHTHTYTHTLTHTLTYCWHWGLTAIYLFVVSATTVSTWELCGLIQWDVHLKTALIRQCSVLFFVVFQQLLTSNLLLWNIPVHRSNCVRCHGTEDIGSLSQELSLNYSPTAGPLLQIIIIIIIIHHQHNITKKWYRGMQYGTKAIGVQVTSKVWGAEPWHSWCDQTIDTACQCHRWRVGLTRHVGQFYNCKTRQRETRRQTPRVNVTGDV